MAESRNLGIKLLLNPVNISRSRLERNFSQGFRVLDADHVARRGRGRLPQPQLRAQLGAGIVHGRGAEEHHPPPLQPRHGRVGQVSGIHI